MQKIYPSNKLSTIKAKFVKVMFFFPDGQRSESDSIFNGYNYKNPAPYLSGQRNLMFTCFWYVLALIWNIKDGARLTLIEVSNIKWRCQTSLFEPFFSKPRLHKMVNIGRNGGLVGKMKIKHSPLGSINTLIL